MPQLPDRSGWVTGKLATLPPCPPFPEFTTFERSTLDLFATSLGIQIDALRQQIRCRRVIDRINTVVGFYTRLEVDRWIAPEITLANPAGIQTKVLSIEYGICFLIWSIGGYISTIEGALNASHIDTLERVDLATLRLKSIILDDGREIDAELGP